MARITFIQNIWHEYTGVMLLSAYAQRAGHQVSVSISSGLAGMEKDLCQTRPDIAGITLMAGGEEFARTAVSVCRRLGIPSILGGPAATLYPVQSLEVTGADFLCRGAGEQIIPALLDASARGKRFSGIKGLWRPEGGKVSSGGLAPAAEPESLPYPDREIYPGRYPFFLGMPTTVHVGRGCPMRCSFCFNGPLSDCHRKDPNYRKRRPVDDVLAEISHLKRTLLPRKRNRLIVLGSDNINADQGWFVELLERWPLEASLPFVCYLDLARLTKRQARLLKNAGAAVVGFGLESGNEDIRRGLLNRKTGNATLLENAKHLHDAGITMLSGNMLALPCETLEDALDTLDMNMRMGVKIMHPSLYQPYPGTRLHDTAVGMGLLTPEKASNAFRTLHHDSMLENPERDALINLHRLFIAAGTLGIPRSLTRFLARLPRNRIYDAIFLLSYSIGYVKPVLGLTVPDLFRHAWQYREFRPGNQ